MPIASPTYLTIANGSKSLVKGIGEVSLSLSPNCFFLSSMFLNFHWFYCLFVNLLDLWIVLSHMMWLLFLFNIQGWARCRLYQLDVLSLSLALLATTSHVQLHSGLDHPSLPQLKQMVPSFSSIQSLECEAWKFGKHIRFSSLKVSKNVPLHLLFWSIQIAKTQVVSNLFLVLNTILEWHCVFLWKNIQKLPSFLLF